MRKLIYFTIGNDLKYLSLLDICIKSLNGFDYDGDILFITSFEKEIRDSFNFKSNNNIFFMDLKSNDILTSSANKLKIYQFDDVNNYDQFIYCDVDTIWIKSPNILFDHIEEDKVYMSTEYHQTSLMSNLYWGGVLLNDEEVNYIEKNNIIGLNAGSFIFNYNMLNTMREIDEFFFKNLDKADVCLEQPYINTFLFRNNRYSATIDRYVNNNANFISEYELEKFKDNGGVLLHFSAGIGDANYKYNNMVKTLDIMKNSFLKEEF
jgi:hypothetical protein